MKMNIIEFKKAKDKIKSNDFTEKDCKEFLKDIVERTFVVPIAFGAPLVFVNPEGTMGIPAFSDLNECQYLPKETKVSFLKLKEIDQYITHGVTCMIIDPFDNAYPLYENIFDTIYRGGKSK